LDIGEIIGATCKLEKEWLHEFQGGSRISGRAPPASNIEEGELTVLVDRPGIKLCGRKPKSDAGLALFAERGEMDMAVVSFVHSTQIIFRPMRPSPRPMKIGRLVSREPVAGFQPRDPFNSGKRSSRCASKRREVRVETHREESQPRMK